MRTPNFLRNYHLHSSHIYRKSNRKRYRPDHASPDPLLNICEITVDARPEPACWNWTPDEVAEFACDLGFPEFQEAFKKNLITGRSLIFSEADKLPKICIRDFEIIKILTAAIRKLTNVDQDEFRRCIDLPIRRPGTLFLWYKSSRNGPISYFMNPSSYYRVLKIIRNETTEDKRYYALLNHWNRINPYREWCPHVSIGNNKRINPMTRTTMKQNYNPRDHPYLLSKLSYSSIPCNLFHKVL